MLVRRCRAGLLVLPLLAVAAHAQETTGLYDRPVLVVDAGMHSVNQRGGRRCLNSSNGPAVAA